MSIFPLPVCSDSDKKVFVDPMRALTLAQLKQDQTSRSRTPTGKDISLHRHYLEPHSKVRLANTQVAHLMLIVSQSLLYCSSEYGPIGLRIIPVYKSGVLSSVSGLFI